MFIWGRRQIFTRCMPCCVIWYVHYYAMYDWVMWY